LHQTSAQIRGFLQSLAADEHARAERFYFKRDREHFIVARGSLRAILGCYLNRAPEYVSSGPEAAVSLNAATYFFAEPIFRRAV